MTEAANTRLRAVTDYVERDPWPDLRRYRPLIGAGLFILAVVLWITSPSRYQASALTPFFPAAMLLSEGWQEWIRRRLQRRADAVAPKALLDVSSVVLEDFRAPLLPFLVFAALFLAAGIALLATDSLWWGSLVTLVSGLVLLGVGRRMIRPDAIRVAREGFGAAKGPLISWRQASAFYLKTSGEIDLVAYRRLDPAKPELTGKRAPEVWLHADGPLSPEKLAELLNAARARWS